jgi:hypothetical protein
LRNVVAAEAEMPTCEQCHGTGYNVSEVPGSRDKEGKREVRYKCFACNGQGFYGSGPTEETEEQVDPAKAGNADGLIGCAVAMLIFALACVAYFLYYTSF